MKSQNIIYLMAVLLFVCSCRNKNTSAESTYVVKYPHIDTFKIGMKSDSGNYALIECYFNHTAKDTTHLDPDHSKEVMIGKEKWRVITWSQQMD